MVSLQLIIATTALQVSLVKKLKFIYFKNNHFNSFLFMNFTFIIQVNKIATIEVNEI